MTSRTGTRIGGHVVVESLEALGAKAAFGLPGIHALPIWEGMRESPLRTYGMRSELNAAFAADGWAHVTGRPAPLVLSTGPGALNSLTGLMEAASSAIAEAARVLSAATRPVIWAGGGVLRSGAWAELAQLAASLDAPVASTYMGKGAFPEDHPLSAGSAADEAAFKELISSADVVLAIGTELGAETTGQYTLRFSGRVIQVDADASRIGATYDALGLVGDAGATLRELIARVQPRKGDGAARAKVTRDRIANGLAKQGRELERGLLSSIRSALPRDP